MGYDLERELSCFESGGGRFVPTESTFGLLYSSQKENLSTHTRILFLSSQLDFFCQLTKNLSVLFQSGRCALGLGKRVMMPILIRFRD